MIKPKPYNSNTFIGWLKILELRNKSPSLMKLSPVFTDTLITITINLKNYHLNNPTFKRKKY